MNNEYLANLLFPNATQSIQDMQDKYPQRELKEDAKLTRYLLGYDHHNTFAHHRRSNGYYRDR